MNDLLTAIYGLCADGTDLHTALTGGLHYGRANNDPVAPYGVYHLTTSIANDTFDVAMSEVGVQFSFFAQSLQIANDLVKHCRAVYDGVRLSTGAVLRRELIVPARISTADQPALWQADIEFLTFAKEA